MKSKFIYWVFDKYLNRKDCDKLKKLGKNLTKAKVENNKYSKIRNSEVCFFNDPFIYELLEPCLINDNKNAGWNFEINYNEYVQFTSYKKNQEYNWHIDLKPDQYVNEINLNFKNKIRKLSMSVNLTDSKNYKGGELEFYDENPLKSFEENIIKCPEIKNQGSIVVFPSYIYHRVTPVTKGRRISLVMWSLGPNFK